MGLVLIMGFGSFSEAQTVIEDPNHLLDQLDQFIAPVLSFEDEFTCGDVAVFDHPVDTCQIGCADIGCYSSCQSQPKIATHTVSQCSSSQISIFSDDSENVDFTSDEFSSMKGNLVKKFMQNLSTYISASGKVVLTKMEPVTFTLVPGQAGSPSYSAMNLSGQFYVEGFQDGPPILFTVLKDVPGVAQLARFRLGSDTWFRLKSVQKVK